MIRRLNIKQRIIKDNLVINYVYRGSLLQLSAKIRLAARCHGDTWCCHGDNTCFSWNPSYPPRNMAYSSLHVEVEKSGAMFALSTSTNPSLSWASWKRDLKVLKAIPGTCSPDPTSLLYLRGSYTAVNITSSVAR